MDEQKTAGLTCDTYKGMSVQAVGTMDVHTPG